MQSQKNIENVQKTTEDKKKKKYSFLKRCLSDKLYLICFTITILFLFITTSNKIHEENNQKESQLNDAAIKEISPITEEEIPPLDVSDYVGVYSRSITMKTPVYINPFCSIDSYKYIYQVKSDKTINKYYYNSCVGSILIKGDELDYVSYNGSRYIGTEEMNFQFAPNILKEVDGYTYKIDEDIIVIKEDKRIEDIYLDFYADNIVITTNNNLYLINENNIMYELPTTYINTIHSLDKNVYKSLIKYQYNFIKYQDDSTDYCYTFNEENEATKQDIAYSIYSIRYDVNTNKFMDIKEILSRTKEESCSNYSEDLKLLSK